MTDLTLLETERLRLSGWRADQVDDLVRLHGDPEVARFLSPSGLPWSREQAAARLGIWIDEFTRLQMGKLRLTRKSDGGFVGRAGYSIYGPTGEPELGYALLRENWGKGYATEAAAALRDWLFATTARPGFIGIVPLGNSASEAVLERIGMQRTHVAHTLGFDCQFFKLDRTP